MCGVGNILYQFQNYSESLETIYMLSMTEIQFKQSKERFFVGGGTLIY